MLTETLYSKIFGTAREKGLVYGISSGLSVNRDSSNWWFGVQVSEQNALALMDIIYEQLQKVIKGDIQEEDIEAAKLYSIGRFYRSAQTVGGTASWYSSKFFFDDSVYEYYKYPDRIAAIKKSDMIDIARSMFNANIWGLGLLGKSSKLFTEELKQKIAPLFS